MKKFIVIGENNIIDEEVNQVLPDTLIANTVEEVKSIIQIKVIDKIKVGEYDNGAKAIQLIYQVNFINSKEKTIFYQFNINGDQPPISYEYKYGSPTEIAGSFPLQEFLNFIKSTKIE